MPPQSARPPTDAESPGSAGAPFRPMPLVLLVIVLVPVLIAVWWSLAWLVEPSGDPGRIVAALGEPGKADWRQAFLLARLLQSPVHEPLKRDPDFARRLSAALRSQITAGRMDASHIRLRSFLCRALGELEIPAPADVLVLAAQTERTAAEVAVRRSALEALAVLAHTVGPEKFRADEALRETVLAASREYSHGRDGLERDRLRATAAFTLGVLGGDWAAARLAQLLDDPCADVRYNAATGLARHGDAAAVPVLAEMLDPSSPSAVAGESSGEARRWKRATVLANALRAARQLALKTPAADLEPLKKALRRLADSPMPPTIRLEARETLHALNAPQAAARSDYNG